MKDTKLYLVRHGESESNAVLAHGDGQSKLSPRGIQQARVLARRVQKLPIEVLFSSDYPRALATLGYIQKLVRRKSVITELIREKTPPSAYLGKTDAHPEVMRIRALIRKNQHKKGWHFSDEENFFDLRFRVEKFLRQIQKRHEKHILAVTHGITMRMIIGLMLFGDDLTPRIFERLRLRLLTKNTGITVCELQKGEWRVLTWNDHAHLG